MRSLALLTLAAALAACDTGGAGICPAVIAPAVVVNVLDATTGGPVAEGAIAVARDGAFADTLQVSAYGSDGQDVVVSLAGAWGRAGEYRVTVERAGYARWERSGVVVRSSGGECPQPVTAVLEARLDPTPP